ncbi:MAG TPA: glycoside hydrolase, partial [Flavobacteriaceae bacterium]
TMYCRPRPENATNFYAVPNLLLQKFPSEEFMATTKTTFNSRFDGEETGLLIMGLDYSYLRVKRQDGRLFISQVTCEDVDKNGKEVVGDMINIENKTFYLRVSVSKGGICNFFYSEEGKRFKPIGTEFKAREGKWIGAKIGFLALREGVINDAGSVDIDWIRFSKKM